MKRICHIQRCNDTRKETKQCTMLSLFHQGESLVMQVLITECWGDLLLFSYQGHRWACMIYFMCHIRVNFIAFFILWGTNLSQFRLCVSFPCFAGRVSAKNGNEWPKSLVLAQYPFILSRSPPFQCSCSHIRHQFNHDSKSINEYCYSRWVVWNIPEV